MSAPRPFTFVGCNLRLDIGIKRRVKLVMKISSNDLILGTEKSPQPGGGGEGTQNRYMLFLYFQLKGKIMANRSTARMDEERYKALTLISLPLVDQAS
jgi:hypothetical protein